MAAQKGTKRLGRTGGAGVEAASSSPIPLGALKALRESNVNAGREDTPYGRAIGARMRNLQGHDDMTEKSLKAIKDSRATRKAKGGKVSAAEAVHKHERAKHKGQPLTKMAKGGSTASKRADGCAVKGKTKGRMV
jgi:hypothetical protein